MTKLVPYNRNFLKKVIDIKENKNIKIPKRYLLKIELNRNNGSEDEEIVIMMNPSKADKNLSDDTVNRIIKEIYIQRKKVKYITILNLFVVFERDSTKLKDYIKKCGYEFTVGISNSDLYNNDDVIEKSCEHATEIIVAWGDGKEKWYRKRENEILLILKKTNAKVLCCNDLNKLGYPRHPSRLPNEIKFVSYSTALKEWVNRMLEERAGFYYKKE